ncbi:hypothetical protein [Syntrophomonas erecta]
MKSAFLILIGVVLVITIVFGILIWRQSIRFEKKALELKKRKEEYLSRLEQQEMAVNSQEKKALPITNLPDDNQSSTSQ